MHKQCLEYFTDIEPFLQDDIAAGAKTAERLYLMFADDDTVKSLKVELTIVVDLGVHFVNATYNLEGGAALILSAYQILQSVLQAIGLKHYPNLERVSASIAANDREKIQLKQHA